MALDPVTKRHKLLLTTISDELGSQGEEYDSFVEHFKGYVPRSLLQSKKTLLAKFDALASKEHLKPGKYDVLKKICEDSGNIDIKMLVEKAETDINELLNTGTERSSHQTTTDADQSALRQTPLQPPPVQETVNDTAGPSAKKARTEVDSSDLPYYMDDEGQSYYDNSGKNGILLILNSDEKRKGREKDVEKLKGFFGGNKLRFEVFDPRKHVTQDLSTEQVDVVLNDVRRRLNDSFETHYYCFICVIMSHGNEGGIKTKNGTISVEYIRQFFNNKNMPKFAGRPKVFFIQACRGSAQQDSQETDDADDENRPEAGQNDTKDEADEIIHIPADADTLLAYATTLGYRSFRRPSIGSWFITECINVFEKYHKKDHLEDMLITVRQEVALRWGKKDDGAKQMPCVWSTLTKRLKLTENNT
ncbi:caspase-3-like isoform X2 [Mercenaria mercenaria]|uniref:caspase-3-like isoform X2 n=1 Tax=Mercenaria mercenaria TaxID=6596 RepID=UPI00234F1EC0|nr:caspase-3-like isoform X2 [Mercenaria mercenaria]